MILKTKYTIVMYRPQETINSLDSAVAYTDKVRLFGSFFSRRPSRDLHGRLSEKIDALFEKVCQILDMRKSMNPVILKVFPNSGELKQAYRDLHGKNGHPRAWYQFELNTIYVNTDDLDEYMLAHEMAHAVIDNFMSIRPPRATAEILARYVDGHLYDDVKRYSQ